MPEVLMDPKVNMVFQAPQVNGEIKAFEEMRVSSPAVNGILKTLLILLMHLFQDSQVHPAQYKNIS